MWTATTPYSSIADTIKRANKRVQVLNNGAVSADQVAEMFLASDEFFAKAEG